MEIQLATLIWATKSQKAKFTFNYKTAKELNTDTVDEKDFEKGIRKQLGSVWRISVCQGNERLKNDVGAKLHNTQKPEELLYRIIAISSKEGDLILDPFGGTMTTAAVAKKLGRNYLMIEQDEDYCAYGKERLNTIEYLPDDISVATYDIKPKIARMPDMIKAGFFFINEWFYLKNGTPVGTLEENGKLKYNDEILDMHSCAALAKEVKAKRLNGFDVWFVKRKNELISIDVLRDKYRQQI